MHRDFTQLSWSSQLEEDLRRIVRLAVFEDLDRGQDWTTISLVPEAAQAAASIVARKAGVIAGLAGVGVVFDEMEIEAVLHPLVQDGDKVAAGALLAKIRGAARARLTRGRAISDTSGHLP